MRMVRMAALAAAALALQSCFFAPGRFDSTLELRRDGRFSFSYTGEMLFFEGENKRAEVDERCYGPVGNDGAGVTQVDRIVSVDVAPVQPDDEGQVESQGASPTAEEEPEPYASRPCTPAEKAEAAAQRARQAERDAQMLAAVIGFDPTDPKSVSRYIAELKRHPGWREVTHKGGNRFQVDYRLDGTADRDFLFPVFDNVVVHTPFVTMRPRTDGGVEVRAPAFGGGGLGVLGALGGPLGPGARAGRDGDDPFSQLFKTTDGTFRVVTDGEIRTNNTAEGPTTRGPERVLSWRVTSLSKEAPRALIALR